MDLLLVPEDFEPFAVDAGRLVVYLADIHAEVQRVAPSLLTLVEGVVFESARTILRTAVLRRAAAGPVAWEQRTLTRGPFSESIRTGTRADAAAVLTRDEQSTLRALAGTAPDAAAWLPRGCFPASVQTGRW